MAYSYEHFPTMPKPRTGKNSRCWFFLLEYWDGTFWLLRSPGIDSKESIPPPYDNLIPARFLAPRDCSKIPALWPPFSHERVTSRVTNYCKKYILQPWIYVVDEFNAKTVTQQALSSFWLCSFALHSYGKLYSISKWKWKKGEKAINHRWALLLVTIYRFIKNIHFKSQRHLCIASNQLHVNV